MKRVELAPVRKVQCRDSVVARYGWSNIMPRFMGVQVFLIGKGFKLVNPGQCVIQWYMRYVHFKPQTVRNAKCSCHCSGPLGSYLYTQMCTVLANFLILMFLSQIYRTQSKKNELVVTSQIHKIYLLQILPSIQWLFSKTLHKNPWSPMGRSPLTNEAPQLKNNLPLPLIVRF